MSSQNKEEPINDTVPVEPISDTVLVEPISDTVLSEKKIDPIAEVVESDVADMTTVTPNNDQLKSILDKLKTMSPDSRNQLLSSLAEKNNINSNKNNYTSTDPKEMLKERLRRKINSKRVGRTSKSSVQHNMKKKQDAHQKRLEELQKLKTTVSDKTESDDNSEEILEYTQEAASEPIVEAVRESIIEAVSEPIVEAASEPIVEI